MSITFTRTREQIAEAVLRKVGAVSRGGQINASDAQLVYDALDMRLKELHKLGKLPYKTTTTVTNISITGGTNTVTLPSDILFPVTFAVRVADRDEPVEIINNREYQKKEDKLRLAIPEKIFATGTTGYLYPVPQSNYTGKLTYQKVIDDTASSTAPDVEVSMMRSLITLCKYDVADDFGVDVQTIAFWRDQCVEANATIQKLKNKPTDRIRVQAFNF